MPGGKTFHLRVSVKGGPPQEMNLRLAKSFIVGRSKICNLYFDDNRMSRQHFALEWDGMEMYVSDLNTTNGTMVNNVKINKKRRLQQGDKISAGSVEMTIGGVRTADMRIPPGAAVTRRFRRGHCWATGTW